MRCGHIRPLAPRAAVMSARCQTSLRCPRRPRPPLGEQGRALICLSSGGYITAPVRPLVTTAPRTAADMARCTALLLLLALALVAVCSASFKKQGYCYSKTLGRKVKNGETLTDKYCTQARCVNGEIARLPCGLIALGPGCKLVKGDPKAQYPGCCPRAVCPKVCYSKVLKRFLKDGQKGTEPGCILARCDGGRISRLPCPLIKPGPGCVLVKPDPNAPYPGCCPSYKCPKPGQCYSKGLDKFFDNGAVWTEPPCTRNKCVDGKVIGLPCGLIAAPRPGCKVVKGTAGAPYPACCAKVVCKCYSKNLKRYFKDGAVWTEPPCARATCQGGNIAAVACPLQAGENCVREKGQLGAAYPKCCPKVTCPKKDQCYCKPLNKIFNDGDKWTSSKCVEKTCRKGKISQQSCPLVLPGPGCKVVPGTGKAFPGCCPKVVCKLQPHRCYSKKTGKWYQDGHTWRQGLCVRATCVKGKIVRKLQCLRPKKCPKGKYCKGAPKH